MQHHDGVTKPAEINTGVATRYCKPSTLDDETNLPTSAAFQKRSRRNEEYLSVYLLDYFESLQAEQEQVQAVRAYMEERGWRCSRTALFATLDIEHTKSYIFDEIAEYVQFKEATLPHCGIFHDTDDLLISELLAECIQTTYTMATLDQKSSQEDQNE